MKRKYIKLDIEEDIFKAAQESKLGSINYLINFEKKLKIDKNNKVCKYTNI